MTHEKNVARTYRRELGLAIAVYIVLLFSAIHVGRPMAVSAVMGSSWGLVCIIRYLLKR